MRRIGIGFVIGLSMVWGAMPAAAQRYAFHTHTSQGQRSQGQHHQGNSTGSTFTYSHSQSHLPPYSYGYSHYIQLTTSPGYGYSRYSGIAFGRSIGLPMGPRYGYLPYIPQPVQLTPVVPPVTSAPVVVPLAFEPNEPKPKVSSPAARMRSLEFQVRGDQRMRDQKWSDARAAYASAVSAAPDRAEAHLRLGLCFMIVKRFDSAIRELKRAVALDHAIARTGKRLDELLGPGSQILRNSILSKLIEWVTEDVRSSDRLFLLGAVLHFMNDPRSREYLESALQMNSSGDTSHITNFLNPPDNPLKDPIAAAPAGLPMLNDQPAPPSISPPPVDEVPLFESPVPLSDAPVPMPVGLSATP